MVNYVYEDIREFFVKNEDQIKSKIVELKWKDCKMYVECVAFNFPERDIILRIGEKKINSQNLYEVCIDCPEFSEKVFDIAFNGSEWESYEST